MEESKNIGLIDVIVPTKEAAIEQCTQVIKEMSACKPKAWYLTKLNTRQAYIQRLKLNRQQDIDNFVALVSQDQLQKNLGAYIALLSGGKK